MVRCDGNVRLRYTVVSGETLKVMGKLSITAHTSGTLLTCIGIGGWLGRIEVWSNLVVLSTDLCLIGGGRIGGPAGLELLGNRHQMMAAPELPNAYSYTGTTRV